MFSLILATAAAATDPTAVVALDAGPFGSPVMMGFSQLHRDGCDDSRVTWATPPSVWRWVGEPDPIAGDWVIGGALNLDLPAGRWVGWVMVGRTEGLGYIPIVGPGATVSVAIDGVDVVTETAPAGAGFFAPPAHARNPAPRFAPGESSWDRQIVGQHRWRPVAFDATGGGTRIEAKGVPLQALVLVPDGRQAEGEVIVEASTIARREWFGKHVDAHTGKTELPWAADGPTTARVARWREWPTPDLPDTAVHLTATRTERVGRLIWLFGPDSPATVTVEGLDGVTVELSEAVWLDSRDHYDLKLESRPSYLRPLTDGTLRGGQGVAMGLGITITVPADAKPRPIHGTVHITRGAEAIAVPVDVDVRAATLDPLPYPVGFYVDLRPYVTLAHGDAAPEVLDVFDRDVAMIRARGMDAMALRYASTWQEWRTSRPDPLTAEPFALTAPRWRAAGGTSLIWIDPYSLLVPFYGDRTRAMFPEPLAGTLTDLIGVTNDQQAVMYVYDEEGYKTAWGTARGVEVAAAIDALAVEKGLAPPTTAGATSVSLDWPAGFVDVAMIATRPDPASASSAILREAGSAPWAYNLPAGRAAPLISWGMDVDGFVQWHWDDAMGDPYDGVRRRTNWQYTLLSPDGTDVWPTTMLESFADGVVDLRYVATLERLVIEAEAVPKRAAAARRGRVLLDALRAATDGVDPTGDHDGSVLSEAALDTLRAAALGEIERLQRRKKDTAVPPGDAIAELVTEIRPAAPYTWGAGPPTTPVGAIPVGEGATPTVDGRLDERLWSFAPVAPALLPYPYGRPAPDARAQLAITPGGLALGARDVVRGDDVRWLIDPDNLHQSWLVVRARDGVFTVERCGFDGAALPVDQILQTNAAPCSAVDAVPMAAQGDTVEVLLPWELLGATTEQLGVIWKVDGAERAGTWRTDRAASLLPEGTVALDVPRSGARLALDTDPLADRWTGTLTVPAAADDQAWTWALWYRGAVIERGEVVVPAGATSARFTTAFHTEIPLSLGVTRETDGPFDPAASVWWPRGVRSAIAIPVFDDAIEVVTRLGRGVTVPLEIRTADGNRLAAVQVTVPAGTQTLRVPADRAWPDTVRVTLGPLLDATLVRVGATAR